MELFKDVLWLRTWRDWLFAAIVTFFVFSTYYILLYPVSERVYSGQFACKEYKYDIHDDNQEQAIKIKIMYFPYIAPFATSEAWVTVYGGGNSSTVNEFHIFLTVKPDRDQWGAWGVRWGCPALQSAWGCQSEKLDLSFDKRSSFEMRRVTYALMLSGGKGQHSLKVGDHIADFRVYNASHVFGGECDDNSGEWPSLTYSPGRVWFWMVLWRNLLLPPWANLLLVIVGVVLTHLLLILRDQFDRCGRTQGCLERLWQKVSSVVEFSKRIIRDCRIRDCLEELWRLKRDIFLLLLVIAFICAIAVITAKAVRIPLVAAAFIIFLAVWWWRWFLDPEEWPPAIEAKKRTGQENLAWLSSSVEAFFQGTLHLLTKNRVLTWKSIKTSWMKELGEQKKPSSELTAEYLFVWGVLDKVAPRGSRTKLWMETLESISSVFEEDCWVLSLPPIESKLKHFIKIGKTIVEKDSFEIQAKNIPGASDSDKWINFSVCLACSRREEIRNNWRGILIKFVKKMDIGERNALLKAFEDRKKVVGKCPPWPELRKLTDGQPVGGEDDQTS